MFPNQGLVKSLLKKLFEKYPRCYEYERDLFADLLPEYNDQKEIEKHLAYLGEERLVTFKEISTRDSHGYWIIKITNSGIQFLNKL